MGLTELNCPINQIEAGKENERHISEANAGRQASGAKIDLSRIKQLKYSK